MNDGLDKHDATLFALAMHLQSSAMIQLGKMVDPGTGEAARNLEGARFSIDVLEMLKEKCRDNTAREIVEMIDRGVMDLQLNFMDELKKDQAGESAEGEDAPAPDEAAADEAPTEAEGD